MLLAGARRPYVGDGFDRAALDALAAFHPQAAQAGMMRASGALGDAGTRVRVAVFRKLGVRTRSSVALAMFRKWV